MKTEAQCFLFLFLDISPTSCKNASVHTNHNQYLNVCNKNCHQALGYRLNNARAIKFT